MGMGVERGGYLDNPDAEKAKVIAVVDAAIAKGIYVIIDWHDHAAENHVEQAKTFFAEMAQKYGQYPNVIFETYNEPLQTSWAQVIKPYHEELVPVIRNYAQDIIIVLGTRTWSQDVDEAANDPVHGTNLAYTLHFYAATHKGGLRDKAMYALNRGIALMVTEWGTCRALQQFPVSVLSNRHGRAIVPSCCFSLPLLRPHVLGPGRAYGEEAAQRRPVLLGVWLWRPQL